MIIKIDPSMIKIDRNVQDYCLLKYPGHPRGCPNYGIKDGCPPGALMLNEILDMNKDIYVIYVEYDVRKFADRMKTIHPKWTDRQAYCCLYWQKIPRTELRAEEDRARTEFGLTQISTSPEANGVNIQYLFRQLGISLEWPVRNISRHVSIGGFGIKN